MQKSLHKPVILEPGQQYSTLLFVPCREYNTTFTLRLFDASDRQSLGYDITVEEGELPCQE